MYSQRNPLKKLDVYSELIPRTEPESVAPTPEDVAKLSQKLTVDERVILRQAIRLLKLLNAEGKYAKEDLGERSETTVSRWKLDVEKYSGMIYGGLKKGEINSSLVEDMTRRLYSYRIWTTNYQDAITLYPGLKIEIGGRLRGIEVLSQKGFITGRRDLDTYFEQVRNARDGLNLYLFKAVDQYRGKSFPKDLQDSLFHFGSRLPLYYLLNSCLDLKNGTCGKCDSSVEDKVRLLLQPSLDPIKPKMFERLCGFAADFA